MSISALEQIFAVSTVIFTKFKTKKNKYLVPHPRDWDELVRRYNK